MDGFLPISPHDDFNSFYSQFFSDVPSTTALSPDSSLSSDQGYLPTSFDDLGIPAFLSASPTFPPPVQNGNSIQDALYPSHFLNPAFSFNGGYEGSTQTFEVDSSFGLPPSQYAFGGIPQQAPSQHSIPSPVLGASTGNLYASTQSSNNIHIPVAGPSVLQKPVVRHSKAESSSRLPLPLPEAAEAGPSKKSSQAAAKKRKLAEVPLEEGNDEAEDGPSGHSEPI